MVISTKKLNISFTDTLYMSLLWLLKVFRCLSEQHHVEGSSGSGSSHPPLTPPLTWVAGHFINVTHMC